MSACGACAREVEDSFRFCPWCAAPQRRKLVEFFPAFPHAGESGKSLRVSRYLADETEAGHTRFSVWSEDGVAEAVLSLDEAETSRLSDFLKDLRPAALETALRRRGVLRRLR